MVHGVTDLLGLVGALSDLINTTPYGTIGLRFGF